MLCYLQFLNACLSVPMLEHILAIFEVAYCYIPVIVVVCCRHCRLQLGKQWTVEWAQAIVLVTRVRRHL